jgi:predicted enzyme related to lactoylglutathione lyase
MTMSIHNALAGVAVTNLDDAIRWYERVLEAAPRRPMPEVAEWQFASGGALQVFVDAERAGRSSVTFVVSNVDDQIAALTAGGIQILNTTNSALVRTAIVKDPDSNQIVFAQPLTDRVAR